MLYGNLDTAIADDLAADEGTGAIAGRHASEARLNKQETLDISQSK